MYGVGSSTDATEMVQVSRYLVPPPPPPPDASDLTQHNVCSNGYGTTAMESLTESLNGSGFVHIAGGVQVNFGMLVSERPDTSVDMEDLKPGMMAELVSWVASKLEGSPATAQNTQARVDPQRAVPLLS